MTVDVMFEERANVEHPAHPPEEKRPRFLRSRNGGFAHQASHHRSAQRPPSISQFEATSSAWVTLSVIAYT